jgi:hypothetical protein
MLDTDGQLDLELRAYQAEIEKLGLVDVDKVLERMQMIRSLPHY